MFRDAPAGAYLVIVEDIPANPLAEQPRRKALQQMKQPEQEHEAPEGGLRNPCVVCLYEEATFIALFCCHVLACAECVQALRVNGVGLCPICREPAINFFTNLFHMTLMLILSFRVFFLFFFKYNCCVYKH